MSGKSTIVKHSLKDILAMRERGEDPTLPDAPEAKPLGDGFWQAAKLVSRGSKTSVHLRLDSEIVEWFKANGKGHLTRMNSVLREYVRTHK